ncbi:hypothetical protein Mapa_003055 [Marchantia paleacea]|nr:hypothetical protein Mapa_003055 [Marchantia paleacea]
MVVHRIESCRAEINKAGAIPSPRTPGNWVPKAKVMTICLTADSGRSLKPVNWSWAPEVTLMPKSVVMSGSAAPTGRPAIMVTASRRNKVSPTFSIEEVVISPV